ncbi:DUF7698 family protein [Acidaminococcus intestini]|jgi:hypothetical protein|uniref:DUF7698 family protein n=1 Tax=Acidaminococcus intestini TaxID=187327 RepID=UPI00204B5E13|nr:hypothetical protein [Acidaminococcus intestini]DAP59561.1 MAG TPA: hypothetical protein [Caudoviricetes sp.]
MKLMEKVAKYHELVSHAYADMLEAKKSGVQRDLDRARDEYRDLMEAVRIEGECFFAMFRMYSEMKEAGNTLLNVLDDYNPENIMKLFKACEIARFTYSSSWSDALKTAYVFEQSGYRIDGMTEINRGSRNNKKKTPALVFEMK